MLCLTIAFFKMLSLFLGVVLSVNVAGGRSPIAVGILSTYSFSIPSLQPSLMMYCGEFERPAYCFVIFWVEFVRIFTWLFSKDA